jgi:hypothetical protein
MTPDQRARIGVELTDFAWRFLLALPAAEAQRRLDLARSERWQVPESASGKVDG